MAKMLCTYTIEIFTRVVGDPPIDGQVQGFIRVVNKGGTGAPGLSTFTLDAVQDVNGGNVSDAEVALLGTLLRAIADKCDRFVE